MTGKTLLRASSTGSLSATQQASRRFTGASLQSGASPLQWSTAWRPAPEHLVEEWRSLSSTSKHAVMQARDEVQHGTAQIYLGSCSLGDAGTALVAEVLRQCRRLRSINLQHNQIGNAGVFRLTEALEQVSGLQVLCLSSNLIGDTGADSVAQLLEQHTSLNLVSLSSNHIGDRGAGSLLTALGRNPRKKLDVDLTHNPVKRLGPGALASLAPVAAAVDRLSQRGVTLLTLLRLYTDGVAHGTVSPRQTSTGEVMQRLLLPACQAAAKSYTEAVTPGTAPPMATVIHAWDALFEDLVRAVASHACGQRSVEVLDPNHHQWYYSPEWTSKSYFIDAFCVNQHAHLDVRSHGEFSRFVEHPRYSLGDPGCEIDKLDWVAHKIVERRGRVLLVVDNGNLVLTRIHCLYEIHRALEGGLPLDTCFSGVRIFPREQRMDMVQRAQASADETKQAILDSIRDTPGGFDAFNQLVLDFIDVRVDREFSSVLDQFESKPAHASN